jgi:hypothetical protein
MRSCIIATLAIASCSVIARAKESDSTKKESVEFAGQQLFYAFTGVNFKEYIPAGETLDHWTKLASIRTFKNLNEPESYARALGQRVKQDNPLSQSAIVYNPKKNIAIIDFITWPKDLAYVEFNIFRIERNGKSGLVAYQYAVRDYDNQTAFLKALKELRQSMQIEMMDRGMTLNKPQTGRAQTSARSRQFQR